MKMITRTVVTAINLTETEIDVLEQARIILINVLGAIEYSDEDLDILSNAVDAVDNILNDKLTEITIIKPIKEGE